VEGGGYVATRIAVADNGFDGGATLDIHFELAVNAALLSCLQTRLGSSASWLTYPLLIQARSISCPDYALNNRGCACASGSGYLPPFSNP
jgi:hypothetical protein